MSSFGGPIPPTFQTGSVVSSFGSPFKNGGAFGRMPGNKKAADQFIDVLLKLTSNDMLLEHLKNSMIINESRRGPPAITYGLEALHNQQADIINTVINRIAFYEDDPIKILFSPYAAKHLQGRIQGSDIMGPGFQATAEHASAPVSAMKSFSFGYVLQRYGAEIKLNKNHLLDYESAVETIDRHMAYLRDHFTLLTLRTAYLALVKSAKDPTAEYFRVQNLATNKNKDGLVVRYARAYAKTFACINKSGNPLDSIITQANMSLTFQMGLADKLVILAPESLLSKMVLTDIKLPYSISGDDTKKRLNNVKTLTAKYCEAYDVVIIPKKQLPDIRLGYQNAKVDNRDGTTHEVLTGFFIDDPGEPDNTLSAGDVRHVDFESGSWKTQAIKNEEIVINGKMKCLTESIVVMSLPNGDSLGHNIVYKPDTCFDVNNAAEEVGIRTIMHLGAVNKYPNRTILVPDCHVKNIVDYGERETFKKTGEADSYFKDTYYKSAAGEDAATVRYKRLNNNILVQVPVTEGGKLNSEYALYVYHCRTQQIDGAEWKNVIPNTGPFGDLDDPYRCGEIC